MFYFMIEFMRENVVFVVSSILIVAGLVTVSFQQQKAGTPIIPSSNGTSGNSATVSDTSTSQTAPAMAPTPTPPSPTTTIPVTKTIAPKPAIRRTGEGGGFDD